MATLRRRLFETAGWSLFQEKEGFEWRADRPDAVPRRPARLTFRSIEDLGPEPFVETMARGVLGTLDRNDRYYRDLVGGGEGWGREMLGYLGSEDGPSWQLGVTPDGQVAGYVLIGEFDEPGRGTIVHIGVVPEQRGNGYIDELLLAGNQAGRGRGFSTMISDVDTENAPMIAAMERTGHSSAATTWHVWHYRLTR